MMICQVQWSFLQLLHGKTSRVKASALLSCQEPLEGQTGVAEVLQRYDIPTPCKKDYLIILMSCLPLMLFTVEAWAGQDWTTQSPYLDSVKLICLSLLSEVKDGEINQTFQHWLWLSSRHIRNVRKRNILACHIDHGGDGVRTFYPLPC